MNTLHVFYAPGRNTGSHSSRSQVVTKDCFAPATKCSNCARKNRDQVTGKTKEKKEYKRCSGCHLFAYCDKDCQREHWKKVHNKHCRILSGKESVPNTNHSIDSCQLCHDDILHKETGTMQLKWSGNSPKTFCHIEELLFMMKVGLSIAFNFHKGGSTCNCSLTLACELPFELGELTGHYIDNCGLDAMLAHALKLVRTMGGKDSSLKDNLTDIWKDLIFARAHMWYEVLSGEKWKSREFIESVVQKVETVKDIYGATNPWWKSLKFSVYFAKGTYDDLFGNMYDSQTIEDPRFEMVKEWYGRKQSQLSRKEIVSENKSWSKFALWPTLWNNSLVVTLPEGTLCGGCSKALSGPVRVTEYDHYSLPILVPIVGENGELVACCPIVDNPQCSRDISIKDITDEQLIKFKEEVDFLVPRSRVCDICFKLSIFSHRCSACLAAQYCSPHCQKEDMVFHKSVCGRWAKDRSRTIRGSKKQIEMSKAFHDSSLSTSQTSSSVSQKFDVAGSIALKEFDETKRLEDKELAEAEKRQEASKLEAAKKRLLKIQSNPPDGVTCAPEGDNILMWKAAIFGEDGTVFRDGIFELKLEFSGQYPYEPPVVKFLSEMFHPNIDRDTGIIRAIITDNWSPGRGIVDILMDLRLLLVEPILRSSYVANPEAAHLFKENRQEYKKRAKDNVDKSWTP